MNYPNIDRSTPAATADPITPATLGPMACISKKFDGVASCPTFCDTRAAMGTADTPAEPMRGFTFPPDVLYIILPNITPAAVPTENAAKPKATIANVLGDKNNSPFAVAPTVNPKKITTMFMSSP